VRAFAGAPGTRGFRVLGWELRRRNPERSRGSPSDADDFYRTKIASGSSTNALPRSGWAPESSPWLRFSETILAWPPEPSRAAACVPLISRTLRAPSLIPQRVQRVHSCRTVSGQGAGSQRDGREQGNGQNKRFGIARLQSEEQAGGGFRY
jgi:hypothetical protein